MTIANNFANDHSKPEVIAAGLNTIRVICSRQPRVMTKTLLRDLSQYSKHKDKQVFHAARGIITLFRELSPKMLNKKDRGKDHDPEAVIPEFGTQRVAEGVDGIELLEEYNKRKESEKDLMAVDGEDSDEEGEWIDVPSDGEDDVNIAMDDSDDSEGSDNEEGGELLNLEDVFELDSEEEEVIEDGEQAPEEPKGPRIDQTRILTQEDFELIKKLKKSKEMEKLMGKKRKRETPIFSNENVDEDDIGDISKGDDSDNEFEPEKKKFNRRKWEQPGETQKQKKKNKPYMMLKMSRNVRHKNTMGQNEKKWKKALSDKRQLKHKLKHR